MDNTQELAKIVKGFYRAGHYCVEEDCWYSCPEHEDYCGEDEGCLCGLNEHNGKVNEALQIISNLTPAASDKERKEMSVNNQNDNFEQWLRKVCFQAPPPEAHDLARMAWETVQQTDDDMPLCPECHAYKHLQTNDIFRCLNETCSEYRR